MNAENNQPTKFTPFLDYEHESVQTYTHENVGNSSKKIEQAISLYYAVRDGIRYNPDNFDLSIKGLRASTTIEAGGAWWYPKGRVISCLLSG